MVMSKKMNSLEKREILVSLLGAMTLVLGAVIFLIFQIKKGIFSEENIFYNPETLIVIMITIIGVVAFLFTLYKKTKNHRNADKLSKDYDIVFTQINQYIDASGLTYTEKKDLKNEILSLFLEAQESGRIVNEVVNNDTKHFIDGMIEAYGVRNYFIYDLFTSIQYFVFYVVSINFLIYYEGQDRYPSYFDTKLDYTLILFFVLSAFVLIPYIYKNKRKKISSNLHIKIILVSVITLGGFIGVITLLERVFSNIYVVSEFLHGGITIITSPFVLVILVILPIILHFTKRKMKGLHIGNE